MERSGGEGEDFRRAVQFFGAVENLSRNSGYEQSPWAFGLKEQRLELTRQSLTQPDWEQAWSRGKGWFKVEAETQAELILLES